MVLDFNRSRVPTLREALFSAINDVERAGLSIHLVRFESA